MLRLIDNTYLHCVGACLAGKASNFNQIQTFLRFVGEVLTCERFYYTADRKGPVYPYSEKVRQYIQRVSDFASIIEYYTLPIGEYENLCNSAAAELSKEINFIDFQSEQTIGMNPFFSNGKDPTYQLHELIMNNSLKNQKSLLKPISSNFASLVISKDTIYDRIKNKIGQGIWNIQHTQALVIAARMLVYEQLSKKLKATYLTSTDRSRLHIVNPISDMSGFLELSGNVNLTERPELFKELSDIIDALLITSEGNPVILLKKAFTLRKDTETIRNKLVPKICDGDAYFIKSKRLKYQYQKILDYYLKGEEFPSSILTIMPEIVVVGIPVLKISVERIARWFDYKLKHRHIKVLASLLIDANRKRNKTIYERLIYNCTQKTAKTK